jgi:hypothetical protein
MSVREAEDSVAQLDCDGETTLILAEAQQHLPDNANRLLMQSFDETWSKPLNTYVHKNTAFGMLIVAITAVASVGASVYAMRRYVRFRYADEVHQVVKKSNAETRWEARDKARRELIKQSDREREMSDKARERAQEKAEKAAKRKAKREQEEKEKQSQSKTRASLLASLADAGTKTANGNAGTTITQDDALATRGGRRSNDSDDGWSDSSEDPGANTGDFDRPELNSGRRGYGNWKTRTEQGDVVSLMSAESTATRRHIDVGPLRSIFAHVLGLFRVVDATPHACMCFVVAAHASSQVWENGQAALDPGQVIAERPDAADEEPRPCPTRAKRGTNYVVAAGPACSCGRQ